jgi:three-Cys-motif partner protein
MAIGTSGGLLDSPKATSVFKHAILRQYVTPFIAKVGSSAPGGRVMLVDGFAGRGRFDDGNPGSAELFMRAAAGLPGVKTSIRLFERKKSDADRLSAVAAEYAAKGLDVTAERADIASRLEATVTSAEGIPLFLFLDPCGQNVPFESIRCIKRYIARETFNLIREAQSDRPTALAA